ncbi:high-potential iron-sulfur protein [Caballeronia sp. LZ062]|uniref:high-potential iron-sulfur protein n=1 Tax=unclassified Caballeronia TaxID=2646786 RepID=UPI002864F874|nr:MULTISPECIES: high-potential iron-sulfur protein [unclassified Caballeronia]MDR5855690.1 high-potential iron-sulfur protein [Caballeronia sp. LZ050]MDR5872522.1 high-potential iron-sulfur protein [Caballeronia sp. LZ062]
MKTSRRTFLMTSVGVASTLALGSRVAFADAPKVEESDPTAQALGYKLDASKVDKAKFPKYAAGQECGNCQFYQGKASDPFAPCPMFGGKQVAAKGWCSAYAKKA